MRKSAIFTAALVLAAPAVANAQDSDRTGFYVGLRAGVASLGDADVQIYDQGGTLGGAGAKDTADGRYDLKSAATFGGVIGYDFGMVRADIEIDYSRHKVNSFTIKNVNGQPVTLTAADRQDVCDYLEADSCGGSGNSFAIAGSRLRQLSAIGNIWVDIPVSRRVTPYLGGGIGVAGFEVDGEGKAKFAWQLGAGVGFAVTRSIELSADYRHREVGKTRVEYDAASGFELAKLKTDSFTAGLRFRF